MQESNAESYNHSLAITAMRRGILKKFERSLLEFCKKFERIA